MGGLRHDFIDFNNHNLRTDVGLGKRYSPTTGRLGTVWSPSKMLSFYSQFSTGTDPLSGALSLPSGSNTFTLTGGRQVEIGAKGLLPEVQGQWTVAAHRIAKDNLLSQDPANPDITEQIGKRSSTGVEFALSVEPMRDWSVAANLALLRVRYKNFNEQQDDGTLVSRSGNVPYGVPERTANLWSTYRVTPQWLAGVGAKYVGKVQSDTRNATHLPAYTLVNALVTYAYSPKTTLTFSVSNLANKAYALSGYGSYMWLLGTSATCS